MLTRINSNLIVLTVIALSIATTNAVNPAERVISPQLANAVLNAAVTTEGESLVGKAVASAGSIAKQDMMAFGSKWSGNAQLFWNASAIGNELRFQINVPSDGRYSLHWRYTQASDYGMVAVFVDNKRLGSFNGYSKQVYLANTEMGPTDLTKGKHDVALRVFGKDDAASNYYVGLDVLLLVSDKQDSARTAGGRLKIPTGQKEQPKKQQFTRTQRLQRALQRDSQSAVLFAAAMHTIERGTLLPANQRTSQFDRLFDETLKRHPGVSRQMLQQLVTDYKALPPTIRRTGVPASLTDLNVSKPLNANALNAAIRSTLPAVQSPSFTRAENGSGSATVTKDGPVTVGAIVKPELLEAMLTPAIASIEPSSSKGYDPKQTITLVGQNFSPTKSEDKIVIFKELVGGNKGEFTSLTPSVASIQAMEMVIPGNITPGHYFLQVNVTREGKNYQSNFADLYIKSPPPPSPVIQAISPNPQYPGRQILIKGQNLKNGSSIAGVWFKPMENQPLASYVILKGEKVGFAIGKVLNATQIDVTIPPTLMAGKYRIVIEAPGAGMSQWFEYEVRAFQYQVNFTKIKCIDESDPEWSGGDEVVVVWVIVGDNTAYAKSTGDHKNYINFDDGDEDSFYPSDRTVFLPSGGPGDVKKVLAINTTLYEWDAGDVKAVNEVIGFVGDLGEKILTGTGQVEWAIVVKLLTPIVQKVVAWVGGNPDHLGDRRLAWSALDLLELTDNPDSRFTGNLDFNNSDDDGSYRISYEVIRVGD